MLERSVFLRRLSLVEEQSEVSDTAMLKVLKLLALILASLALASAFAPANHAVRAPAVPAACASPATDFAALDDALDNADIPTDPDLIAARNCGFCIG